MSDPGRTNNLLVLRIAFFLLGVAACVYLVNTNLPSLIAIDWERKLVVWPHAFLALTMFVLHVVLVFYAWYFSLKLVGVEVSFRSSALVFVASLVTRYLPGGVWHLGSRLLAMSRMGKSPYLVSVTLVLEQMAALAVSVLLVVLFASVSALLFPEMDTVSRSILDKGQWFFLLAGAGLIVVLYPPVFKRLLTWVFSWLKGKVLSTPLTSQGLFGLYGIHALSLLMFAVGYHQVLAVVAGEAIPPLVVVIAVVLVATVLGFLAPFIPGGIGVRESAIVVLLTPFVSAAEATAMAIAARILIIIVEFALLSLMILFQYRLSDE